MKNINKDVKEAFQYINGIAKDSSDPEIADAFSYVFSQLARRAKEVGGIEKYAQQLANRIKERIEWLKGYDYESDCTTGTLYQPKNLAEVRERANATGERFLEMFGKPERDPGRNY